MIKYLKKLSPFWDAFFLSSSYVFIIFTMRDYIPEFNFSLSWYLTSGALFLTYLHLMLDIEKISKLEKRLAQLEQINELLKKRG